MPVYQYTVRDATGAMRSGTSEAENQDILKKRLQEQGFTVNDVKQTGVSKKKKAGGGWGKVKLNDLSIFTDIDAADLALRPETTGTEAAAPSAHGMENILIEELELGVRSYNCLKRAGIQTVGDLISKSEAELNAIPNFGKKSIDEVIETLHARGFDLRAD